MDGIAAAARAARLWGCGSCRAAANAAEAAAEAEFAAAFPAAAAAARDEEEDPEALAESSSSAAAAGPAAAAGDEAWTSPGGVRSYGAWRDAVHGGPDVIAWDRAFRYLGASQDDVEQRGIDIWELLVELEARGELSGCVESLLADAMRAAGREAWPPGLPRAHHKTWRGGLAPDAAADPERREDADDLRRRVADVAWLWLVKIPGFRAWLIDVGGRHGWGPREVRAGRGPAGGTVG
jgi:hypothetical protein